MVVLRPKTAIPELDRLFRVNSSAYGCWKFETSAPICSFVSLGSKNYAFITRDGLMVVKVRGFTLSNSAASQVVNIGSMQNMLKDLLAGKPSELIVESFNMRFQRQEQTMHNKITKKRYTNQTFNKRLLFPDECGRYVETVPFGARHTNYADVNRIN